MIYEIEVIKGFKHNEKHYYYRYHERIKSTGSNNVSYYEKKDLWYHWINDHTVVYWNY